MFTSRRTHSQQNNNYHDSKQKRLHQIRIGFGPRALPGMISACIILAAPLAHADDGSLSDVITKGKVSGYLRSYEWSNNNFYNSDVDNNVFTLGGKLKAESGEVGHFSVGAAFYTSHALSSTNGADSYDPTLGTNINTLGELYLNYNNYSTNVRIGRQAIDTPFANSADYRMVPALYQGATVDYKPSENFSLTFGRISRYKTGRMPTSTGPITKRRGLSRNRDFKIHPT